MIYTLTLNPSIDYIVQLDTFELGKVNRSSNEKKFAGGKGINVSRILKQLSIPAVALGFLGGFTGNFIADQLKKEEIDSDFVAINDDTRINVKLKSEKESEINAAGPVITLEEQSYLKKKLQKLQKGDLVILSGSLPHSLPQHFYQELIAVIRMQQSEFVLDTTGQQLVENLASQPFLIKPNRDELEEIVGETLNTPKKITTAAQKLLDMGAQHVIVSLGADGAYLFSPEKIYFAAAPTGILKNSVGAGDSMIAGFIGTYMKTFDIQAAFRVGVACGSATAFSDDLAQKEQIHTVLKSVQIKELC